MKTNKQKVSAFILMEVLIGLTILGITVLLFWQSYNNQLQINQKIANTYAFDRLKYDVGILKQINKMNKLKQKSYAKIININWNDTELTATSLGEDLIVKFE
jgi:Tfp pilus assembly protein PilE